MSDPGLISEDLRKQHADQIAKSNTFETQGVSVQTAKDYLSTPEGTLYWQRLAEADPSAPAFEIDTRAIEHITSGRELPLMAIINEPLVKLTRLGDEVSLYSSYFTKASTVDEGLASGRSLHDYFGLPGKSEAASYRMDQIKPLRPTEVFISHVAPTSELGGQITRAGGGEQYLVPNRTLFTAPTHLRDVDNTLNLAATVEHPDLSPNLVRGAGVVGAAAMAYDAYTTTQQYQALSAKGNKFGADALLHHYEGRTAGGVIGGFGAGAAYGALAGSETGPGALVTGAVGGVVGAFAGDKIATAYNEHQVNHQTGTDGVTYAYDRGQWTHTAHSVGLGSYDLPTIKEATTHAPAAQVSTLDYQRTTAVTALALANPGNQDTKHITLDHTDWHATHSGWTKQVELPGVQTNSFGIPSSATVSEPADAKTSAQLNQIAANRQFNNAHYAENVSKAYVMDYYGNGWNKSGPLPQTVTDTLKLPSETHIKDPVTGHDWTATGKGHFTRDEVSVG